ncbi:MAG: UDP-N-acetylmuramoyl-L-alanyl-D-glutamate--2,6-diaminopimelate ligase, partial [Paraprevotella sp.]|nr:UDP-N-acetylmuramoyl-L-alanyl-D-glutamate--2,6-diaminopimelate ligase [Paraprevotella sp.]
MILKKLIEKIPTLQIIGNPITEVVEINIDSRQVAEGHLFIALKGTQTDGHQYIDQAIKKGAKSIICEDIPQDINDSITYVQVKNSEDIVGQIATTFYDNPTEKLQLIGVTGTNGKTTIATLLYMVFRKFGYKCGLCSTVCNYINGEALPTEHTTPDPITLNRLLGRMADEGCKYAFMEVSSHSVAQKRIGGLRFAGGIFTNLTRDHLDYHKTVENYRDAKKTFFDLLPKDAFVITNADDRNGIFMVQNTKAKVYTYSQQKMADFTAHIQEESLEGMLLEINGQEVSVPFVGRFNVSNLAAVYAAATVLGKPSSDVLIVMSTMQPVNGRFETIQSREKVTVVVDYAHTPDALTNVLETIEEITKGQHQIITVCGAGGNRDKGKRPLMAQEAVKHSNRVILTSDNPRFEEPQDI